MAEVHCQGEPERCVVCLLIGRGDRVPPSHSDRGGWELCDAHVQRFDELVKSGQLRVGTRSEP